MFAPLLPISHVKTITTAAEDYQMDEPILNNDPASQQCYADELDPYAEINKHGDIVVLHEFEAPPGTRLYTSPLQKVLVLEYWKCFHCGEVFTTADTAREHFGADPQKQPGCILKVSSGDDKGLLAELRRVEAERDRLQFQIDNESTEADRRIQQMQSEHQIALRREEEKGYARGLDDARRLDRI